MKIDNFSFHTQTKPFKSSFPKTLHISSLIAKISKKFDIKELVKVYACVGGIPAYLKEFNDSLTFEENVNRTFFNKDQILFDDAERLLKDELREPYVYLSIAEQISEGATTLSEISTKSKVDVTNLPKYLRVLENMGLIKKIYPVIGERKSKRGIYKILDNYFHFWLKFVHRYKEEIELTPFISPLIPLVSSIRPGILVSPHSSRHLSRLCSSRHFSLTCL